VPREEKSNRIRREIDQCYRQHERRMYRFGREREDPPTKDAAERDWVPGEREDEQDV